MNKFYVLHLSDLHITKTLSITLRKLIESLSKNKELANNKLVILITGDIINMAAYSTCRTTALNFFKKLKKELDTLNVEIIDICIVPGNHDKVINDSQKMGALVSYSNIDLPFDENEQKNRKLNHLPTKTGLAKLQESGFEDYLYLCNEIFKIFNIKNTKKSKNFKTYNKTYGIDKKKIGKLNIIIIRLNTALLSCGAPNDEEKFKLSLGPIQHKEILSEYQHIKNEIMDNNEDLITFCIAHHPSQYLTPKESERLNNLLIAEESLNVDFFLSGHIHDGSLSNLSNHNRSVISLETGIGWPDSMISESSSRHKDHRYAIYYFDIGKNIFCAKMLKTNNSNEFVNDTDYLNTNEEKSTGKIFNPLRTRNYAFIHLNDYEDEKCDSLFIDRESIVNIKNLYKTAIKFTNLCNKSLEKYIYEYLKILIENIPTDENIFYQRIKRLSVFEPDETSCIQFFNNKNIDDGKIWIEYFISYLKYICDLFVNLFKEYFQDAAEFRAVFRVFRETINGSTSSSYEINNKISKDFYEPICESPFEVEPRNTPSGVMNQTKRSRCYTYDNSLIKYAFEKQHSIIYSVNPSANYFVPDNWDDFLVIIPEIKNYYKYKPSIKSNTYDRPYLAFTFSLRLCQSDFDNPSIKEEMLNKLSRKLFLLQYIGIENILSNAVSNFLDNITIDLDELVKYNFNNNEKEE